MLSDELIVRLQNNADFLKYKEFVFQKINELNSVDGLDQMSNEDAGEEAKIRYKTLSKLLELVDPIFRFGEKKQRSDSEVKKAEKAHGL